MYIVGEIKTIIGSDIPECFMVCDGQQLETEEYPEIFAKIGYTFGGAHSHFHLPQHEDVGPRIRGNRRPTRRFLPELVSQKTIICVMTGEL